MERINPRVDGFRFLTLPFTVFQLDGRGFNHPLNGESNQTIGVVDAAQTHMS